jgi:hypothetical protein
MKNSIKSGMIWFLKKNGFEKAETNSYYNDKCNVVFMNDLALISNNHGDNDAVPINFFAIYGCLVYRNYIKKYVRI